MPTLTITNLTAEPVLVQELYSFVPASGTLATERTQSDVEGMPGFLASVADGILSYTLAYSAAERAAGVETPESLTDLGAPVAASTTNVHAAYAGNVALAFPGPFTNPDVPRTLDIAYVAAYDGGDTTVVGTDQFGAAQTETFTAVAGSTVAGAKIFATVTSASQAVVGANAAAASIGGGDILGVSRVLSGSTNNILFADGVSIAGTWDATENSVDSTTVPDGSVNFVVLTGK